MTFSQPARWRWLQAALFRTILSDENPEIVTFGAFGAFGLLEPGEERVRITVNGQQHEIDAGPDVALLWILRNDLGLTTARYGCGIGKCGACTVLVDGEARRSCMIPLGDATTMSITTLEGLARSGTGGRHPLQDAFIAEQAAQCGYCISGIVMAAAALLDRTPEPTRRQIQDALAENLCRCGSHPRIIRAIEHATRINQGHTDDGS